MPRAKHRQRTTARTEPSTIAPTPQLAQHHTVIANIGTYTVESNAAWLHSRGWITDEQATAADRFYTDWAVGICGAREGATAIIKTFGSTNNAGMGDRQLQSAEAYRQACAALGRKCTQVLTWLVCDDMPFTRMAEKLADQAGETCNIRTAVNVAAEVLRRLSDHYAGDGRGAAPTRGARVVAMEDAMG